MSAAPTINGRLSGQTTTSEAPIDSFAGMTIGDERFRAADTLTITLSNSGAARTLADGTGSSGIVADGSWKLKANRDGGDYERTQRARFQADRRPTQYYHYDYV